MRRWLILLGAGTIAASAIFAGTSTASSNVTGKSVFYLSVRSGQCAIWPHRGKLVQVVPCSNRNHNLETFWVGHGGWGHASATHATKFADAQVRCRGAYQRRFGHPIRLGFGWEGFWPDPGAESAKYGDRLECFLVRYPGSPAMGPGRH